MHAIRHEMMGMLAVNCTQDMVWMARIAIVPVYWAGRPEPLESYYAQFEHNSTGSVRVSKGWDLQDGGA
ncbi:hypothetical protein DL765_011190 [Monosporascus sp. GIB2]|nr:hypothetical protein DL765_011190 [Monosporascus sp. GIB2]